MKDTRSKEIKVGIITVAGIILIIVGIALGKSFNFTTPENVIKFKFPSSNGLQEGEPIVVNGVERGKVLKVYNDNNQVLVEGQIDNINDIYSNATARITILEITGGKKIEISPGTSNIPLKKNDFIQGSTPPDIAGLIAVIGELSSEGANIIKKIDTIVISVNNLLSDEEFIDNIKSTINNANQLTDDLNNFTNDNFDKLSGSINDLAFLTNELKSSLNNDSINIKTIINDIDHVLNNVKNLTNNANSTLSNADSLIFSVNQITQDIRQRKGVVSKLIYDEEFSSQLDSTVAKLQNLINLIEQYGVNVNVRLGTRP